MIVNKLGKMDLKIRFIIKPVLMMSLALFLFVSDVMAQDFLSHNYTGHFSKKTKTIGESDFERDPNDRVLSYARELAGERIIRAKVRGDGSDAYHYSVSADGSIDVESGTSRGVLYAVYDVLDGKMSGDHVPAFSIRGLFECGVQQRYWTPEMARRFIDRMGRYRMNTLPVITAHGYKEYAEIIKEECAKRGIDIIYYTYYQLDFGHDIPRKYWAVDALGNPRSNHTHLETNDRLCASNPEGLDLYRKGIQDYLRNFPEHENLLYATPDGADICLCSQCKELGTVGQAIPFFEIFMQETGKNDINREWLTYYQRYQLPDDMTLINKTDAVMFDTHTRDPFFPLHDPKMMAGRDYAHESVDDRAKGSTKNRYLYDRLREWREAYPNHLYIHENLMIHAALGRPRMNTPVYIEDLKKFHEMGIDGVVYEAYESGIRPFLPQLDVLARAMWDPYAEYTINDDVYPELHEFYELVDTWKKELDWKSAARLVNYVLSRPDRDEFDWLWIGYRTFQVANYRQKLETLSNEEEEMLNSVKLWDYLEGRPHGREQAGRLIESIAFKIKDID